MLQLALWISVAATCVGLFSNARLAAQTARRTAEARVVVTSAVSLDDADGSVLAHPTFVFETTGGGVAIADASDRNIKIYDQSGRRRATIGRMGQGPGEFMSIRGMLVVRDTLAVYDFSSQAVSRFASEGKFVSRTTIAQAPYEMRTINDSLVLHIRHPGQRRPLLAVARHDGTILVEFFERPWMNSDPRIRSHAAVFADARGGLVHAAVFGDDSVFTFDLTGRRIGAVKLSGLGSLRERWIAHGERAQDEAGRWFHDGLRAVMSVVALPSGAALVQVASYDTKVGTDLISGGDAYLIEGGGPSRSARRLRLPGRPMAVDGSGALIAISYADSTTGDFRIERWRISQ